MGASRAFLIAAIGASGAVACGDNITGSRTIESSPVVAVETVAPERVRAGDPIEVTCRFLDADGRAIDPIPVPTVQLRFAPAEAIIIDDADQHIATKTGDVEVSCTVPELVVFDESPALIAVDPGEIALLGIELDRDRITAGESVNATCSAFDGFGNRVDDAAPILRIDPELPGNTITDLSAELTGSGLYQLACDLPNAATTSAELEVVPGLPAAIVVSAVPSRPVYARGEIIELGHQVVDRFDNPVPEASVSIASQPLADISDGIRFRYFANGFYELTATVMGPTEQGALLEGAATVLVDGSGPQLQCDQPIDGSMLDHPPGSALTFAGSVSGLAGITQVQVNGTPVAVNGAGSFSTSLPTRFGVNFVELAAVDEFGKESTRVCSFLVADRYVAESGSQSGAISLNLRQSAVDDSSRSGGLNSLGDLLHTAINSSGLKAQIHSLLLGANPLKNSCDVDTWFGCAIRSRVDYLSSNFAGPNTVALGLVSGGINTQLSIRNTSIRLRVDSNICDFNATVSVGSANVAVIFDASLSGGRPRLTVRPGSVQTTVSSPNLDSGGFCGTVVSAIGEAFFRNTIRDLIANQVSNLVRTSLGSAIDGVVGNLDVGSLATTFDVSRLDGGGAIGVSFTPTFTQVNASASRLLFGLGTRFTAPAAHARPTLGAPVANPPGPNNPSGSHPAAIAIHSAVLNQVLHALWRGGLFDATLDASGATATLATGLPPVVSLPGGNRVEIALGDVAVALAVPGLFPEPVPMILGVRASMRFQRTGDDISFDDFQIEELLFTSLTTPIDATSRDLIEGFLAEILENLLGSSLNDALPALPIPSFELPASVSQFGLPSGATLGIDNPSLSAAPPQILLLGGMAIQ